MLHEDFLTALGPRPIGSAANIEAKEYILGTLDGFEKKVPPSSLSCSHVV